MDIFARLYNHGIPGGVIAGLVLAGWVKPVRLEGTAFLVLCTTLVAWFAWLILAPIAAGLSDRRRRAAPETAPDTPLAPPPASAGVITGAPEPRTGATDAAPLPAAATGQSRPGNTALAEDSDTQAPPAPDSAGSPDAAVPAPGERPLPPSHEP